MKTPSQKPERQDGKQDRLKAALKANMGRRKQQARVRAAAQTKEHGKEQKE